MLLLSSRARARLDPSRKFSKLNRMKMWKTGG